jgi:hypothetical protein
MCMSEDQALTNFMLGLPTGQYRFAIFAGRGAPVSPERKRVDHLLHNGTVGDVPGLRIGSYTWRSPKILLSSASVISALYLSPSHLVSRLEQLKQPVSKSGHDLAADRFGTTRRSGSWSTKTPLEKNGIIRASWK